MTTNVYSQFRHIDFLIDQNSVPPAEVLQNKVLADYFWSKVRSVDSFGALIAQGFFKPENIKQKDGGWYWPPLDYLMRISTQIKDGENKEYASKLLDVIRDVTEYRSREGAAIDNYFIWFKFVTILSNLDNKDIHQYLTNNKIDFANWLEVWLPSKHERSIVASDLSKEVLPKFITDRPDDIAIAEKIVLSLLKINFIEPEKYDPAVDSERKKAILRSEIYWLDKGLFNNHGAHNLGKFCSLEFLKSLIDQLRLMLRYKHFDHQVNLPRGEKEGDRYRLVLRRCENGSGIIEATYSLSAYKITKEVYDAVQKEDLRKAMRSSEIGQTLIEKKITDGCDSAQKLIRSTFDTVRAVLPREIIDDRGVERALTELFKEIDADFSSIWARSLERVDREYDRGALEIFTATLIELLKGKVEQSRLNELEKISLRQIWESFLTDEYRFPLFRRILLFIIGENFDLFGEYFHGLIDAQPNLFYSSHFKVELYDLLKTNAKKLFGQEDELLKLIQLVPEEYKEWHADDGSKYIKYKQLENMSALTELDFFKERAGKLKAELEIKVDIKPPQRETAVVWTGNGKSFFDEAWFVGVANSEIVSKFEVLSDEEEWGPNNKTVDGTADIFQVAVKNSPEKFCADLKSFEAASLILVNHLMEGLKDACNDKKQLDWGKVLEFIERYIESDRFKSGLEERNSRRGFAVTPSWVVQAVAGLLMSATDDDKAMPTELFDACEALFQKLLKSRWGEPAKTADIQESINTPFGRTLEAYINFSLLRARVYSKQGKSKGFNADFYDSLLAAPDKPEAFTFAGRYLPNFTFLNESWIFQKVEDFKAIDKTSKEWKGFFQGYVWGPTVYLNLFERMREHYTAAIETKHDYEQVQKQIVEHAVLVYLYGFNNQELESADSLIRILLDRKELNVWEEILNAVWSMGRRAKEKYQQDAKRKKDRSAVEKAQQFWFWFFANVNKNFNDDNSKNALYSSMARLGFLFDDLSDPSVVGYFKIIAPHVDRHRDAAFFIENLDRFVGDDVSRVADIYLVMVQADVKPDYDKEHIKSIVAKIYASGFKDKANQIVDLYASRGLHFLREIWQANNPNL